MFLAGVDGNDSNIYTGRLLLATMAEVMWWEEPENRLLSHYRLLLRYNIAGPRSYGPLYFEVFIKRR